MLKYFFLAIGILVLLYLLFGNRKNESTSPPVAPACPDTFTLHPIGGLFNPITTTYSVVNGKYYSKISGDIGGFSGSVPPKEITKEDFLAACKILKTPLTGPNLG